MHRVKIFILLGGLGTRISSLFPNIAKGLIPIEGKPFIEHLINKFTRALDADIYLLLGHKSDQYIDWLDSKKNDYSNIFYKVEQTARGAAGAAADAILYFGIQDPIFLVNGDTWWNGSLEKFLISTKQNQNEAALALRLCQSNTGNLVYDEQTCEARFVFNSSGNAIYAGLGIFEPQVFKHVPMTGNISLEEYLVQQHPGSITGHALTQDFIDIGTPLGMSKMAKFLESNLLSPAKNS